MQAVEEEKSVYERTSSKSIYLNLAVHTLRRLREESPATTTAGTTTAATSTLSPTKNPNSVSHELILAGPKATQTSFSVHRCGKQSSPPSSFSGTSSLVVYSYIIGIICYVEKSLQFIKPHMCDTNC